MSFIFKLTCYTCIENWNPGIGIRLCAVVSVTVAQLQFPSSCVAPTTYCWPSSSLVFILMNCEWLSADWSVAHCVPSLVLVSKCGCLFRCLSQNQLSDCVPPLGGSIITQGAKAASWPSSRSAAPPLSSSVIPRASFRWKVCSLQNRRFHQPSFLDNPLWFPVKVHRGVTFQTHPLLPPGSVLQLFAEIRLIVVLHESPVAKGASTSAANAQTNCCTCVAQGHNFSVFRVTSPPWDAAFCFQGGPTCK